MSSNKRVENEDKDRLFILLSEKGFFGKKVKVADR